MNNQLPNPAYKLLTYLISRGDSEESIEGVIDELIEFERDCVNPILVDLPTNETVVIYSYGKRFVESTDFINELIHNTP